MVMVSFTALTLFSLSQTPDKSGWARDDRRSLLYKLFFLETEIFFSNLVLDSALRLPLVPLPE
jgi:hypothetical protein